VARSRQVSTRPRHRLHLPPPIHRCVVGDTRLPNIASCRGRGRSPTTRQRRPPPLHRLWARPPLLAVGRTSSSAGPLGRAAPTRRRPSTLSPAQPCAPLLFFTDARASLSGPPPPLRVVPQPAGSSPSSSCVAVDLFCLPSTPSVWVVVYRPARAYIGVAPVLWLLSHRCACCPSLEDRGEELVLGFGESPARPRSVPATAAPSV
jgi:hypothetical protein